MTLPSAAREPSTLASPSHLGALRRAAAIGVAGLVFGCALLCSSAPPAKTAPQPIPANVPEWTRSGDAGVHRLSRRPARILCDVD